VQKFLKLFIQCSDHYRNLPHVGDISNIFEKNCGQGIRKLVVDLVLYEYNNSWLPANYRELLKQSVGQQILHDLLLRMSQLWCRARKPENASYKRDFSEYYVDGFVEEDDDDDEDILFIKR